MYCGCGCMLKGSEFDWRMDFGDNWILKVAIDPT